MQLTINDGAHEVDADPDTPLLWAIRDLVGLTGTKFGCGKGICGACTLWLDGTPVRSCLTRLDAVAGRKVTTIEAVGATPAGAAAQKAWLDLQVVQCGYCQSGQIMSAAALLTRNPAPTDADIDAAMGGNVCRCGTYLRLRAAIHLAAGALRRAPSTAPEGPPPPLRGPPPPRGEEKGSPSPRGGGEGQREHLSPPSGGSMADREAEARSSQRREGGR